MPEHQLVSAIQITMPDFESDAFNNAPTARTMAID